MWKALLLPILALLPAISAQAQKNKKSKETTVLHVYNKDWKPCDLKDASYLVCEDKLGDTSYQVRYYQFAGPLISVETFADEKKTTMHGFFAFYDNDGRIDSCGYAYMGKKDRDWMYFNDSLILTRFVKFDKGKVMETKDSAALKAERDEQKRARVAKGSETNEDREASFNNGEKNWKYYLTRNIEFPKRAQNLGLNGTVRVCFMIDPEGVVRDIWLNKSVEYSVDEESIRLIKSAPRWEPAVKQGQKVNAWRIQPITFRTN
jgi:protein TonB